MSLVKAELLDTSLFEPVKEISNPNLEKEVNFSFKEIQISEVLNLLSKIGDFNFVLPKNLDKKLSITITHQKIKDALKDIAAIAKLQYQFNSNTIIFAESGIDDLEFISVSITFYKANDIMLLLNDSFFAPLKILQDPSKPSPFASLDPSQNSLILVGSKEQIDYALKFIKSIDKAPCLKIYAPRYLSVQDIRKLIRFSSHSSMISVLPYEANSVIIKAPEPSLNQILELIKSKDQASQALQLNYSVYLLKSNLDMPFQPESAGMESSKLSKLNNQDFEKFFNKSFDSNLIYTPKSKQNFYSLKSSLNSDKIDPFVAQFKLNEQELFMELDSDFAYLLLDKNFLLANREFKKLAKTSDYLLFVFNAKLEPQESQASSQPSQPN